MGYKNVKAFTFRLVCNGIQLDTFGDEEIEISNNITGLFDLGVLPSDFTRQIMLPGTNKNNEFFEHVYDISVTNPYLWKTNVKVEAYFDFNGVLISQGYLQLNSVNMATNNRVDSYEVTIYGLLSSFARDVNKNFLTDLTSLSVYNHTSSIENITSSWEGNLFDGDIVYPLVDYGQNINYQSALSVRQFGVDNPKGALTIQDFKPAIRVKKVLDKVFEEYGYTYSSSFMQEPMWDDVYMICDNGLETPFYPGFGSSGLDNFFQFELGALSGSGISDYQITSVYKTLPYENILFNPNNSLQSKDDGDGVWPQWQTPLTTNANLTLNLNFGIEGSGTGFPQFKIRNYWGTGSTDYYEQIDLPVINNFMRQQQSAGNETGEQEFTIEEQFTTSLPMSGSVWWKIGVDSVVGSGTVNTFLNYNGSTEGRLKLNKVKQAADGRILDIPSNMPFAENGVKLIDFIKGIQLKYNLVIYPSTTVPNQFIIEPFNQWYNKGEIINFNNFIDLNQKLSVTPANNLAVNQLNFQDKLDNDYISQQFKKAQNRDYGRQYYNDTSNFFSQGEFKVETTFSSSPLRHIPGTGTLPTANPTTCQEYDLFCPSSPGSLGCDYDYISCEGVYTSGTMIPDSDITICARVGTSPGISGGVIYNTGLICTGSI
jgi:hypothetical protein